MARRSPDAARRPPRPPAAGAPAPWQAFAVAAPGLEAVVAGELAALGFTGAVMVDGGVEFTADTAGIHRANLHLRAASRVLVRLAAFRATSFAELERRARGIPWERVLPRGAAVALRVTCRKSRLYHSDAVAERLLRDLGARRGAEAAAPRPDGEDDGGQAAQLFVVRLDRDVCTVSADSSGAHLHLRGYRRAISAAPLRETLAAAMVLASGWDGRSALVDPFCGSGTIPIEAAMIAARMAPGRNRSFRFMKWPGFDRRAWERCVRAARDAEDGTAGAVIVAGDRSQAAMRAAAGNAERAGVSRLLRLARADVRDLEPPSAEPGWLVSNPPYGIRLGDRRAARLLLAGLDEVLRARFRGWELALLVPRCVATGLTLPARELLRTTNGGLDVRLVGARVPG